MINCNTKSILAPNFERSAKQLTANLFFTVENTTETDSMKTETKLQL